MAVEVDDDYKPSEDEPFMNERQREYFRAKLLAWKEEILKESKETIAHLQDENHVLPDLADRASSETDRSLELRTRDRQRKLISKIDAALKRIEDGSYGYCEETGEPISLKRLDAGRSPRCRSRRRNAMSAARRSIATIDQTNRSTFSKVLTSTRPMSEIRSSGMTTSASSECCM